MTTYDDEVYSYLTQPENYRSAKQIANQIGAVDDKLLSDFWLTVQYSLKNELDQLQPTANWQVFLAPGKWLSVHLPAWKHMGVNCDTLLAQPDFGLHCDPGFYDRGEVDKLLNEAKVRQTESLSLQTQHWPCFRHLKEYDFRQQQTLERILPEYREEAVKGLVSLFIDFVMKYNDLLGRIHVEAKKHTAL